MHRKWTYCYTTSVNNNTKAPYFFLCFDVDRGGPIIADSVFSSMLAASKGSTNNDRHTAAENHDESWNLSWAVWKHMIILNLLVTRPTACVLKCTYLVFIYSDSNWAEIKVTHILIIIILKSIICNNINNHMNMFSVVAFHSHVKNVTLDVIVFQILLISMKLRLAVVVSSLPLQPAILFGWTACPQ